MINMTTVSIFLIMLFSCSQQKKSETYFINKSYNGPVILIYGDTINGIKINPMKKIFDFRKSNLIMIKEKMPDNDFISFDDIEFFYFSKNTGKTKISILLNEDGVKNDTTKYVFLYSSQTGNRNHKISYQSIIISDRIHYHASVQTQNHILDSLSK